MRVEEMAAVERSQTASHAPVVHSLQCRSEVPGVSYGFPYPTLLEISRKLYSKCYVIVNYTKVGIYTLSILDCELLLSD